MASAILTAIGLVLEIFGVYFIGRRFLVKKDLSLVGRLFEVTWYVLTLQRQKLEEATKIFRVKLDLQTDLYEIFKGFFLVAWGFAFQFLAAIIAILQAP